MHVITVSDMVLIASGIGSMGTITILFIRLTWWLSKQFSAQRDLLYKLHRENGQRVLRLEMWANRHGYQPAGDQFYDAGPGDGNGRDKYD